MILLDTHTLLWSRFDDSKLSQKAKKKIETTEKVFVSIASLWEIAIKQSIGKLTIDKTITEIASDCVENDIQGLNITPLHLDYLKELPPIHGDPFDRLIIAQAICEKLTIVSKDEMIREYNVKTIW